MIISQYDNMIVLYNHVMVNQFNNIRPNGQVWYLLKCKAYGQGNNMLSYCRNRQYSYVYVCGYLYYIMIYVYYLYHPSDSYFTPPWGVSTNQG